MRTSMLRGRLMFAAMALAIASSCAAEAVSPSVPSAGDGIRGTGPMGQSLAQRQGANDERWISYRDFWFDYSSTLIDTSDASKVTDVAGYLKQNPSYLLGIDGAMAAGDAELGERRVDTVREALIKAGVPEYKIHTGEFGDPRLRRERRVEVLFSAGR